MTTSPIFETVRTLLAEHTDEPRLFDANPSEVSLQSLGIPSVEMIGIIVDLEDRFDCMIDESRLYEISTLADLVRFIEARVVENASAAE